MAGDHGSNLVGSHQKIHGEQNLTKRGIWLVKRIPSAAMREPGPDQKAGSGGWGSHRKLGQEGTCGVQRWLAEDRNRNGNIVLPFC